MKKTEYIFSILIFIVLISVLGCSNTKLTKDITYDVNFSNDNVIKSNDSLNFNYTCDINVNKLPKELGNTSINYQISVIIKDDDSIYENVIVTCKLNESIKDILLIKTRDYFGVDLDDNINLNASNKGIITGVTTWIDSSDKELIKKDITAILNENLLVKTKWNGGEEYVEVSSENINITWFE
jgi:hypothetical protein